MTSAENDKELPLVQHLIELRSRLLRISVVIILLFFGLYVGFAKDIYGIVAAPLLKLLPANSSMIATDITSPLLTPMRLTFFVALVLAIPYILYQLWAFVAPGLYRHEKRIALPILVSSVLLFYIGMAFAYFLIFPLIFRITTQSGLVGVTAMTDITKYLDFVLHMFFAFGFIFEIPVATVLLISANIISARALIKKRPYVILVCFVVGMILTPPDVTSQCLLAIPMWALFEIGVHIGLLIESRRAAKEIETAQ